LVLSLGSRLAIMGVTSNSLLRTVGKGDEADPEYVGKKIITTGAQIMLIIGTQNLWTQVIKRRLLNPIQGAFAAVTIPIIGGGVISYLIDEEEGLQNYFDFIDLATDPEQTDQAALLTAWSIGTIWTYYKGGGKNQKEGFFEFEN
jgi:hypothetical protein